MQRDLNRLADEPHDLLVVGGGIHGLATAWDAAQRGMKVALVEQGDFGSATSTASHNILHGGFRYLRQLDVRRMRASMRERNALVRLAPHLVKALPVIVPCSGRGLRSRSAVALALRVNDLVSLDRNRGVRDSALKLPRGRVLSRAQALELVPILPESGLRGAGVMHDAQMRRAERMNLAFAHAADREGAVLVNYAKAIRLVREGSRAVAVKVEDRFSGSVLDLRAKVVADLGGPWNGMLADGPREVRMLGSFQLVTSPAPFDPGYGLAVDNGEGRHYFYTPWNGLGIWGTAERLFEGRPDDWRMDEADIMDFIAGINRALPALGLERAMVRRVYGGLQPVEAGSRARRHPVIEDHPEIDNLLRVEGVKYTTCRLLAEQTVDRVVSRLGGRFEQCRTARSVLPGGDFHRLEDLESSLKGHALAADWDAELLLHRYGSEFERVLKHAREGDPGPEAAMIRYAVAEECAFKLEDVMLRRAGLGTGGWPAAEELERHARVAAEALNWDAARMRRELDALDAAEGC